MMLLLPIYVISSCFRSLFLVFIEFSRNNLDKLRLVYSQFLLNCVLFLDGLSVGSENKLLYLLFGQVLF